MNVPKPKRRWLRFSLQSLLLMVLVVAAFLAGRASLYSSLRKERERADVAEMALKLEELLAAEIRGEIIDAAPARQFRREP